MQDSPAATGSSLVDSPARTFHAPARVRDSMARGRVFGLRCGELLGTCTPDGLLPKTLEQSLFEGSPLSLTRLPKSGMTQNGKIYAQATWARRTGGRGSGLWPTPTTDERDAPYKQGGTNLRRAVKMWPTPQARDGDARGAQAKRYLNPERSNDLPDAVAAAGTSGQLNPFWVEWLMGYPIFWTEIVNDQMATAKGGPKGCAEDGAVSALRCNDGAAETSSRHCKTDRSDCVVPGMPYDSAHGRRDVGEGQANPTEMCGLREGLRSTRFAPAQDLRFSLSEDPGERKRIQAVAWETEPDIPRVATGVKHRVDRIKGLGNAVVPEIPELIGRQLA